jgi:hypothetical protein
MSTSSASPITDETPQEKVDEFLQSNHLNPSASSSSSSSNSLSAYNAELCSEINARGLQEIYDKQEAQRQQEILDKEYALSLERLSALRLKEIEKEERHKSRKTKRMEKELDQMSTVAVKGYNESESSEWDAVKAFRLDMLSRQTKSADTPVKPKLCVVSDVPFAEQLQQLAKSYQRTPEVVYQEWKERSIDRWKCIMEMITLPPLLTIMIRFDAVPSSIVPLTNLPFIDCDTQQRDAIVSLLIKDKFEIVEIDHKDCCDIVKIKTPGYRFHP